MVGRSKTQPSRIKVIDHYVGTNIRLRRKELGLSQPHVADAIGVSFQQLQKYERGTNRISGSTLFLTAEVLDVPVGYFFKGLPDHSSGATIDALTGVQDLLSEGGSLELLSSYRHLSPNMRRALVAVSSALVSDGEAMDNHSQASIAHEEADTNVRRVRQNNAS